LEDGLFLPKNPDERVGPICREIGKGCMEKDEQDMMALGGGRKRQ